MESPILILKMGGKNHQTLDEIVLKAGMGLSLGNNCGFLWETIHAVCCNNSRLETKGTDST